MKRHTTYAIRILESIVPLIVFVMLLAPPGLCEDPWQRLRQMVKKSQASPEVKKAPAEPSDPWAKLRALYLPFSEAQEVAALTRPREGKMVSHYLTDAVKPYRDLIAEASETFNIPSEILAGLIMVESAGNPRAKAKTSSARGLTQTISSTFELARNGLRSEGVNIKNDPYNPRASIFAGSWYLNKMYEKALSDNKPGVDGRKQLSSWRYPLQYYYAGPGHGKKESDIVIIYAGGRRVVVDKAAYSRKVLRWAKIMQRYG